MDKFDSNNEMEWHLHTYKKEETAKQDQKKQKQQNSQSISQQKLLHKPAKFQKETRNKKEKSENLVWNREIGNRKSRMECRNQEQEGTKDEISSCWFVGSRLLDFSIFVGTGSGGRKGTAIAVFDFSISFCFRSTNWKAKTWKRWTESLTF